MSNLSQGFKTFISGIGWIKKRPLLLILLYLPLILGMTLTVAILGSYSQNFDAWMEFILFDKPEGFWALIGYWITYASLFVGIVIVSILAGFLLPSIIASPFYDYVSMKVETDLTGRKGEEVSLLRSLLLIKEEVKKVVFILAVSLIALFIPILNVVVPVWLLSWEFFDYPLARRGMGFRQRLTEVFKNFWEVAGMSVWFLIPFIQFFLMPLAVIGGTMIAVKSLNKK